MRTQILKKSLSHKVSQDFYYLADLFWTSLNPLKRCEMFTSDVSCVFQLLCDDVTGLKFNPVLYPRVSISVSHSICDLPTPGIRVKLGLGFAPFHPSTQVIWINMFLCSGGVTNPSVLHCLACLSHIVCLRGALTISRLCMVCQAWQTQTPELWKGTDTHIYPCGRVHSLSVFSCPRPRNWSSVLMSTKWTTLSSLESSIRSLVRWESV